MRYELENIEHRVRAGQITAAREQLSLLYQCKLKRPEALRFANLARRSSDPLLGLSALRPYVRPAAHEWSDPSSAEKTEYAACLNWLGLRREASILLASVSDHAPALLVAGFLALGEWRYPDAIRLFESYSQASGLGAYDRLVARVNLLAAYVHEERWPEAEATLLSLERAWQDDGSTDNLRISAYKQELEMAVARGDLLRIQKLKNKLAGSIKETDAFGRLFLDKWLAVAELRSTGDPKPLRQVALRAAQLKHYETIRDCDAQEALCTNDSALALKVYQGTPHAAFRERFSSRLGLDWPAAVEVRFAGEIHVAPSVRAVGIVGSNLTNRLLAFLRSDFYAPPTVPEIFNALYPNQFFDQDHGPNSVHQALHRLRSELPAGEKIQEQNGRYRYFAPKPVVMVAAGRDSSLDQSIRDWASRRTFSVEELAGKEGWSTRKAQRYLAENRASFAIRRQGRSIRYEWVDA